MSIKRDRVMGIAQLAAAYVNDSTADNMASLRASIQALSDDSAAGVSWVKASNKLLAWINSGMYSEPPFSIFAKGNGKLPFWSFSSLPVVLCPGAGDCVNWCYSLKSWRYPFAFFRQLQNSLLMAHFCDKGQHIQKAFLDLPENETVRLYVDGDFHSRKSVVEWWSVISERPDLAVYGYSKSIGLILEAFGKCIAPVNYHLNISSGGTATESELAAVHKLHITRGNFIAVDSTGKTDRELIREHKATSGKPTFLCPGLCGECTASTHACGSDRFKGIDIIISLH